MNTTTLELIIDNVETAHRVIDVIKENGEWSTYWNETWGWDPEARKWRIFVEFK